MDRSFRAPWHTYAMNLLSDGEIEAIRHRVWELRLEHRDLDDLVMRLQCDGSADQLQLQRLKKRKLMLKDMIAKLENKLIPDLNA